MLVLTPVSAFSSGYPYPYPIVSPVAIQNDYLEAVAQARAETVRYRRQQKLRRRQVEEQRRQAALAAAYQQQVLRERQRRLALARQREEAYIRALLEAQELERAEQLRLRRAREQQVLAAIASLGFDFVPEPEVHRLQEKPRQVHRVPVQSFTEQARREPSPVSSARERLQHRLERESDPEVRGAVESLLSVFPELREHASVDRKGKGKAREVPTQPIPRPSSTRQVPNLTSAATSTPVASTSQPATGATLREAFQERLQSEADPEVKESLYHLFTTLYGVPRATTSSAPAAPAAATSEKFKETVKEVHPSQDKANVLASEPTTHNDTNLHRTPALPPAISEKILALYRSRRARRTSLGAIKEIEDALHALEDTFVFPTQLDFTPPATEERGRSAENGLMYTSNNRAVHAYENALNGLLERLDAVESQGDSEVRGRRKEVVREVERALRDIERRVEESRERSRERGAEAGARREEDSAAVKEAKALSFKVPIQDATSQAEASQSASTPVDALAAAPTADEYSEVKDAPAVSVEESAEIPAAPTSAVEEPSALNIKAVPSQDAPHSQPDASQPSDEVPTHDLVPSASPEMPTPETESVTPQPSLPLTVDDLLNTASTLDSSVPSVSPTPATLPPITEELPTVEAHAQSVPEVSQRVDSSAQTAAVIQETNVPEASSIAEVAEGQLQQAEFAPEAPSSSTDVAEDSTSYIPDVPTSQEAPIPSDRVEPSLPTHSDASISDASSPTGSYVRSESGSDAFLLSSHPLQDPVRKTNAESAAQESEEPEIVTHAEAEGDNTSEWSEVEA